MLLPGAFGRTNLEFSIGVRYVRGVVQDGLGLAAEHGFFFRGAGSLEWDQRSSTEDMAWQARAPGLGSDPKQEIHRQQSKPLLNEPFTSAFSNRLGCPAPAAELLIQSLTGLMMDVLGNSSAQGLKSWLGLALGGAEHCGPHPAAVHREHGRRQCGGQGVGLRLALWRRRPRLWLAAGAPLAAPPCLPGPDLSSAAMKQQP